MEGKGMAKKILLVDDQMGIRRLLGEVFTSEGYHVATAANGYEALELVEKEAFNLALVDMKMPGMSGLELLRQLKQVQKDIAVIIMTAYGELKIVNEVLILGAYKYITKPFDIDELIEIVGTALQEEAMIS
jgi:two-component system response regulator (stage 0 sporulation protein F)